jgi:hypothetical protein
MRDRKGRTPLPIAYATRFGISLGLLY